jgi:hypothetical protein
MRERRRPLKMRNADWGMVTSRLKAESSKKIVIPDFILKSKALSDRPGMGDRF